MAILEWVSGESGEWVSEGRSVYSGIFSLVSNSHALQGYRAPREERGEGWDESEREENRLCWRKKSVFVFYINFWGEIGELNF